MPAFAMTHGGIGDALKQMHAFDDGQQKIRGQHVVGFVGLAPRDLVKQMIQALPLFGADLFAHLARILASAAMHDVIEERLPGSKVRICATW